jgi:ABC-type transporter Mla maintaining outer membrane lipid asymmetry ATPase subunit MlaF
VFTDAVSADVAKAELYFYNLSDLDSVDLFVPAAKVVAIAGVTKGGGKNVALRAPLTLKLELRHGDRLLAALDAVQLNRRAGVTIVLTGKADAYRAAVLENVIQ